MGKLGEGGQRAALHRTELAVSCVDAIVLSVLVMLGTLQDAEVYQTREICL